MIISINKKIQELDELSRKKKIEETNILVGEEKPKKSQNKNKMTEFYRSICQCGAKNPKFNGYCEECLKKMKKRY